jgi:phosphoenolpyruvate carboxylase
MPKPKAIEIGDKDVPLRDDIRLLGRILGDTVREQSGETVFGTVEHIRQPWVRFVPATGDRRSAMLTQQDAVPSGTPRRHQ